MCVGWGGGGGGVCTGVGVFSLQKMKKMLGGGGGSDIRITNRNHG